MEKLATIVIHFLCDMALLGARGPIRKFAQLMPVGGQVFITEEQDLVFAVVTDRASETADAGKFPLLKVAEVILNRKRVRIEVGGRLFHGCTVPRKQSRVPLVRFRGFKCNGDVSPTKAEADGQGCWRKECLDVT